MTVYADYAFYTGTYKGQLAAADFDRVSVTAGAALEQLTMGRSAAHADDEIVQLAFCAVCDATAQNERGELASQSVGSWSKTYKTTDKSAEQRLYDAVFPYLSATGLLYRGIG